MTRRATARLGRFDIANRLLGPDQGREMVAQLDPQRDQLCQVGRIEMATQQIVRAAVAHGPPDRESAVRLQANAMEMIENKGLAIDRDLAAALLEPVIVDVPDCEVDALVLDDGECRVTLRPGIEETLIAEATVLDPVMAPGKAVIGPAAQAGHALLVAPEHHPAGIEPPISDQVLAVRREAMGSNGDRGRAELAEESARIGIEIDIRIDVHQHLRPAFGEEVLHQERLDGEDVVDPGARRLHKQQFLGMPPSSRASVTITTPGGAHCSSTVAVKSDKARTKIGVSGSTRRSDCSMSSPRGR